MPDSQYSWWNLFKKIGECIVFVFSFFRRRKEAEQVQKQEQFNKVSNEIKENYDKIDKEKDKPKDDIDKRLKNLF